MNFKDFLKKFSTLSNTFIEDFHNIYELNESNDT
jgi:hypothetical protein